MNWIVVRKSADKIRIFASSIPVGTIVEIEEDHPILTNPDDLVEAFANQIVDIGWKLEITKQYLIDGLMVDALADALLAAINDNRSSDICIYTSRPDLLLEKLWQKTMSSGNAVHVSRRFAWPLHIRILAAYLIALSVWIWSVMRFARWDEANTITATDQLYAIHGEISNRTKMLLNPEFWKEQPSTYLVLGRPRQSLKVLRNRLFPKARSSSPVLIRPISWKAAMTSLSKSLSCLADGYRIMTGLEYQLKFTDMVAVSYRIILGHCHSAWWARSSMRPKSVIYGHTGLADTSRLERTQQQTGTKTVHLVHGLSGGWSYAGISDMALFQCRHDADRHRSLVGYGQTECIVETAPQPDTVHDKWLVFTNYLHPTNPAYLSRGPEAECRVLDMVHAAAGQLAFPVEKIIWRPHPGSLDVAPEHREAVFSKARNYGFTVLLTGSDLAEDIQDCLVLTTPSTIAVETLALGKLPVILKASVISRNSAIAAFPFSATSHDDLVSVIEELKKSGHLAAIHRATFDRVGPSADIDQCMLVKLLK